MSDTESPVESLTRMVAMQQVALTAVLLAISKQPGVDAAKLTQDLSDALMHHEASSELKPAGVSSARSQDYVVLRAMLRLALPALPIR